MAVRMVGSRLPLSLQQQNVQVLHDVVVKLLQLRDIISSVMSARGRSGGCWNREVGGGDGGGRDDGSCLNTERQAVRIQNLHESSALSHLRSGEDIRPVDGCIRFGDCRIGRRGGVGNRQGENRRSKNGEKEVKSGNHDWTCPKFNGLED